MSSLNNINDISRLIISGIEKFYISSSNIDFNSEGLSKPTITISRTF